MEQQIIDNASRIGRSMIAVIDTMVQRGAIRGEELSTLGQLRDQCVQTVGLCEQLEQEKAAS